MKKYVFPREVRRCCRQRQRWLKHLFRTSAVDSLSGDIIVNAQKEAWRLALSSVHAQAKTHHYDIIRAEAAAEAEINQYAAQEEYLTAEINRLSQELEEVLCHDAS